jgi:hypothetical protein
MTDHCDGSCSWLYPAPGTPIRTTEQATKELQKADLTLARLLGASEQEINEIKKGHCEEDRRQMEEYRRLAALPLPPPGSPEAQRMPLSDYWARCEARRIVAGHGPIKLVYTKPFDHDD